jgi:hypothetical protein
VFLAIGVGLAAGVDALTAALVLSAVFNFIVLAMERMNYGSCALGSNPAAADRRGAGREEGQGLQPRAAGAHHRRRQGRGAVESSWARRSGGSTSPKSRPPPRARGCSST